MAVKTPIMDKIIPANANRLLSDRLPKMPKITPATPSTVPATGTKPAQKLKIPNPVESKA